MNLSSDPTAAADRSRLHSSCLHIDQLYKAVMPKQQRTEEEGKGFAPSHHKETRHRCLQPQQAQKYHRSGCVCDASTAAACLESPVESILDAGAVDPCTHNESCLKIHVAETAKFEARMDRRIDCCNSQNSLKTQDECTIGAKAPDPSNHSDCLVRVYIIRKHGRSYH